MLATALPKALGSATEP